MPDSNEKVQIVPGPPMPELDQLPAGAGKALQHIGVWMVIASIIGGVLGLYVFARIELPGRWGGEIWSTPMILMVVLSSLWAVGFAWAVMRLGTALRWLEAIGKKLGVE